MRRPLALLVLLSIAFRAGAMDLTCPPSVSEKPVVSAWDRSWSLRENPGLRQVEGASVFLGDPDHLGSQVPDEDKINDNIERVVWNLVRAPTDRFWIVCSYRETSAILFREIDKAATRCEVRYRLLASGKRSSMEGLSCK